MRSRTRVEDLAAHLERTTRLEGGQACRVIEEALAFFSESLEEFVRRRHAELQTEGRRNPEIFRRIAHELGGRRFAAPPLSERQIRRLIYG
jgi:hypothetical protein